MEESRLDEGRKEKGKREFPRVSSKQCDEAESTVTNMAANNSGEEDDLGVLIYRESQLRKAEAAIAAESKKKTSSASTHHRTSTRKKRCL